MPVASVVINKPGAGGALSVAYLEQHTADPHYLFVASTTQLTSSLLGVLKGPGYGNLTPLALLVSEYLFFTVKADAQIKTGKDLLDRLRKDPGSVSFGFSSAIGNGNHIAVAKVARAAGVDVRKHVRLARRRVPRAQRSRHTGGGRGRRGHC